MKCCLKNIVANDTWNKIGIVSGNGATSVQRVYNWIRKFRASNYFNLENEETCDGQ